MDERTLPTTGISSVVSPGLDEFSAALQNYDVQIVQTRPATGRWETHRVDLPGLTVHHGRFAAPAIGLACAQPDHAELLLPWILGTPVFYRCQEMTRRLGIYGSGAEHDTRCGTAQGFTIFSIHRDTLGRRLQALDPTDPPDPRDGHFTAAPLQAEAEREIRAITTALMEQARALPEVEWTRYGRGIAEGLLTPMLQAAFYTPETLARPVYPPAARTRVLRRVREFLHEQGGGPIELQDLCQAAETGLRNLQNVFRQELGITPYRFLRYHRLHRAKRLLETGWVPSVKAAALDTGFLEFGRFAVEYRRLFGESPSATLARSAPARSQLPNGPPSPRALPRARPNRGDRDAGIGERRT